MVRERSINLMAKSHRYQDIHPKLLIPTYISCLNEESKMTLRENGINLETTKEPFRIFNYASYLKCLEFHSLYYQILLWCNRCHHTSEGRNYLTPKILQNQLIIFRELCKMFIRRCKNLKYQIKFKQTWFTDNHYLSTYPHWNISC